jgi:ATP-dependent RNA helicase RhlE
LLTCINNFMGNHHINTMSKTQAVAHAPAQNNNGAGHPDGQPGISFAELGLGAALLANIAKLGWDEPTPIQRQLIPLALAGRDLFGIAQTGTGKTAAFALPLLERIAQLPRARQLEPHCLIIAPTRELTQQIEQQFKLLGAGLKLRTATVYGGVSERPQIDAMKNGVEILVATPGRMLDLIAQGWISLASLSFCVLDEADRMFDMGFIRDIRKILAMTPKGKQTLLLSATMPDEIRRLAADFLVKPEQVRIGITAPPAELTHELWRMPGDAKQDALLTLLKPELESAIVFCRTRSRADGLARRLGRAGERVAALHSSRSQAQRDRALADFKAGRVRMLVATDVASRGLDVEGIQLIVNYDVPMVAEDYVHRVGRTARAMREGRAVTFAAPEEEKYVARIEKLLGHRISEPGAVPAQPQKDRVQHDNGAAPNRQQRQNRTQQAANKPQQKAQRSHGGNRSHGRNSAPSPEPVVAAASDTWRR